MSRDSTSHQFTEADDQRLYASDAGDKRDATITMAAIVRDYPDTERIDAFHEIAQCLNLPTDRHSLQTASRLLKGRRRGA